jgi:DNA-binding response OmpR family regulator
MTFGLTHGHQAKPLALLVDGSSSGTIAQSLRAQAFRVDVVASLGQLTARSYHPRPDAVIVVNNLPDGSWLAAVLAARARWRSSIVVVGGTGTTPLSLTAHQLDVLRHPSLTLTEPSAGVIVTGHGGSP